MSTLLLFGATGDLAQRMLWPSLFGLDADGLLPAQIALVGTALSEYDDEKFRRFVRDALGRYVDAARLTEPELQRFLSRIRYVSLDASKPEQYDRLAQAIGPDCSDLSIFLSTGPSLFGPTIEGLSRVGLSGPGVRLALEKPLGHDFASSCAINDAVASVFSEAQTFRLDHYLGKETVQNLLAMRFGNALFEPMWTADQIDHVQITVAETVGLEGRAGFYDGAGALRDMVQNHMLQLLALVAMEPPAKFQAGSIRDEKVKVLRSLRPIDGALSESHIVLGQYVAGNNGDKTVPGYLEELGRQSDTETYVALKAHIDNWRWSGVPFYLRTGKRLRKRKSEICIQFKSVRHSIFSGKGAMLQPNKLVISLQPEENIRIHMMTKQPGLDRQGLRLREVTMDIANEAAFADVRRRIAYERLMLDLIEGDPTLFVRRDEVEAQWEWIDRIRAGWQSCGMRPYPYVAGSAGPDAAVVLTGRSGHIWHA